MLEQSAGSVQHFIVGFGDVLVVPLYEACGYPPVHQRLERSNCSTNSRWTSTGSGCVEWHLLVTSGKESPGKGVELCT